MERIGSDTRHVDVTSEHLDSFAVDGLRTLCLAYRVLPTDEYEVSVEWKRSRLLSSDIGQTWSVKYRQASTTINNRNELVAQLAEEIEKDLILLGGTGIEDKLQDVSEQDDLRSLDFLWCMNSKYRKVSQCYCRQASRSVGTPVGSEVLPNGNTGSRFGS